MKKFALFASLALFLFAGSTYAGNIDLFTYNKSAVTTEMAPLNELELYVLSHPGVSLSDMIAEDNPMASHLTSPNNFNAFNLVYDKALGIGGFWWGCLLGPVGIVAVYLIAEDKAETKSAIIGCVVSGLVWGGGVLTTNLLGWRLGGRYWW